MQPHEAISPSDAEQKELAEMKLSFVLRDYESYFQAGSRMHERAMKLRELEATIIAGLFGLILVRGQSIPANLWIPFVVIIAAFMVIDLRTMASLRLIAYTAKEAEKRLQVTDLKTFRRHVIAWTYGNTKGGQQTSEHIFQRALRSLSDPIIIAWHGGLALAVFLFLYFWQ